MLSTAALRGHAVHLLVFGLPVAGLVAAICRQELQARRANSSRARDDSGSPVASPGLRVAVGGLAVAAVVHLTVLREHFREDVRYGFFFLALTVAQCGLAFLLTYRPEHRTVRSVAVASGCVVALWLVSRTTGLPLGGEPWRPESFGAFDIAASCAEIATAVGCLSHLWALGELRPPPRPSAEVVR
jgi:hypothetical protein